MRKKLISVMILIVLVLGVLNEGFVAYGDNTTNPKKNNFTRSTVPTAKLVKESGSVGTVYKIHTSTKTDSMVILCGTDGNLYRIDKNGNAILFVNTYLFKENKRPIFKSKPAMDISGNVYAIACPEGEECNPELYAFNFKGDFKWKKKVNGDFGLTPLVASDCIIIRTTLKYNFTVFDKDGNLIAEKRVDFYPSDTNMDIINECFYYVGAKGTLMTCDFFGNNKTTSENSQEWSYDKITAVNTGFGLNLCITSRGDLYRFNSYDGGPTNLRFGEKATGIYPGKSSRCYIKTDKGNLVCYDFLKNEKLWTIALPIDKKKPTYIESDEDGRVFVTGPDEILYAYNENGLLEWKYPIPISHRIGNPIIFGDGVAALIPTTGFAAITLALPSKPVIMEAQATQEAKIGDPAGFLVKVAGSEPFHYQWKKDGVDIPGATMAEYIIKAVTASDEGEYSVEVSNVMGTTDSGTVLLKINE